MHNCRFIGSYFKVQFGAQSKSFQQRHEQNLKPLIFCVQDESFLEDVNMMLNTGDIPNLYEKEERLEIIEKVGLLQHQ